MASESNSPEYSPDSTHASIIEIFNDSADEGSIKPKIEFPNSPRVGNTSQTTELLCQINFLDT